MAARGHGNKQPKSSARSCKTAVYIRKMIRRHPRIKGILPVRIWGTDRRGNSFTEHSCTASLGAAGASLLGVRAGLSKGDVIGLQYRNRQARFRVVWIVPARAAGERHIGLECLEPDQDFWPVTLPLEDSGTQVFERADGRRSERRYPVSGTAYVSRVGASEKEQAKVGDISLTGCYLETSRPDYVGRRLELWIRIAHNELQALGVVRVRVPRIGMGIEFTFMSNAHRRALERLIANLGKIDTEKPEQQQKPVQHGGLTAY